MIEKAAAYKTQDGVTHATLEEAQLHALNLVTENKDADERILRNSAEVIAILKLKPRKPRAVKAVKAVKAKAPKPDTQEP